MTRYTVMLLHMCVLPISCFLFYFHVILVQLSLVN